MLPATYWTMFRQESFVALGFDIWIVRGTNAGHSVRLGRGTDTVS
jgi:hypothetical protein